ncbi:Pre-rRNA-processing protein esf2, putative (macronuclear) [Tetrahymena thermophila SB210]|uniref:Pre-rRNA-processing protein esf2, putative n=1 Tax=Tetrahymena thermophila (strain SB210) TaxID=312017 RepID=I7MJA9_TETTS|nr:Pre-rRNA-processing protein esf2, putative [Tetrahymena thermophila SB210]EAS06109.1 Pre-rRNA-processing protein esf2, putative [Tetrahymena thermophila SB210]|eukprot:XP_001026354.1 Pre-rRNA-processing protein esf2, putative [Tetrahymena thermophila SB210]
MGGLNKETLSDIGLSDGEDLDDDIEIDDEVVDSDQEEQEDAEESNDEQDQNDEDNSQDQQNQSDDQEEEDDNDDNKKEEEEDQKEQEFKKLKLALKNKNLSEKEKQKMIQKVEEFNKKQQQKGVCYLSRIPPYMKATYIRKLLEPYGIERVYLAAEDDRKRKMRIKNGGNKRRCYTEGWVEFKDKRIAKRVALSLNCTKMVQKTRNFYGEDLWNIKYLPKFKWENLTERLNYQNRVRKEKLQQELQISKKEQDFYRQQLDQSKKVQAVEKRKLDKNQTKVQNIARRTFIQRAPTKKVHNAQSEQSDEE